MFDQYSLAHFSAGVLAYFMGISLPMWSILNTVFEYIENTPEGMAMINKYFISFWIGKKEFADTFDNKLGDMISAIFGWIVARNLDKYGKENNWFPKSK